MMIILISITNSLSAISDSFCVFRIHCWFRCDVSFEFHRDSFFWFRLVRRMECEGLIVYRMTMAFVQSPRPILVIDAECICGLLIHIFVILIVVAICHLTLWIRCFVINVIISCFVSLDCIVDELDRRLSETRKHDQLKSFGCISSIFWMYATKCDQKRTSLCIGWRQVLEIELKWCYSTSKISLNTWNSHL